MVSECRQLLPRRLTEVAILKFWKYLLIMLTHTSTISINEGYNPDPGADLVSIGEGDKQACQHQDGWTESWNEKKYFSMGYP